MRLFLKLYYYWAMKKRCELRIVFPNNLSYFILYHNNDKYNTNSYLAELPVSLGRKCIYLSEFYKSCFSAEFHKIKHLEDEQFSF